MGGFRYANIAEGIIKQIKSGRLKPGDPIPSARELRGGAWKGQRMAIASATRVQRQIIESGLVEVSHGRRIIVRKPEEARS